VNETNGHAAAEVERELEVHRHLMRFGQAESRVAPVWSMRDTSVSAVADHLARLWTMAGDDGPRVTEKGLPHARASVLNLIVTVPDEPSAGRVVETMMGLGFRHPSRAIVLVASPGGTGPTVDAAVSAHCHAVQQAEEQVCYEEVVLTVRGEAAEHLDGIVAPLLIHDLPTLAWWPGDPPFADPVFDQLVELSDKLIIDSSDFSDLLVGFRRLANLRRRSGVGDLAWKRLGWWQELTAQFFDAPRFRRYLPNLNRVRISYALPPEPEVMALAPLPHEVVPGAASPIAQAILYASWIASRLTWKRHSTAQALEGGQMALTLEGRYAMVELQISGVRTGAAPPGDLLSVRLRAHGETGAAEFIIDREGDECVVASNADGMTAQLRRARMEEPLESELLATSLVADRHDEVYEAAIRASAIFLAAARPAEEAG
jgi:glucose-6-phosphate dehydrogenase assembly protein OpcA